MTQNKTVTVLTAFVTLAIVALAGGSFVLSFTALKELATEAGGISPRLAFIWPLIVDLSLVVYTATVLANQLNRWPVWFPVLLVMFYAGTTIVGNIAHAPATPLGWFIAALPPLSLILATECLRTLLKHTVERSAVLATLAELTTNREQLNRQVDRLTGQREKLTANIADIKRERVTVTDSTKATAAAILAERPAISGAELGRELGKSESLGRKLKRELAPAVTDGGNGTGKG